MTEAGGAGSVIATAPPITTDRLILRAYDLADFDAAYAMTSDDRVHRFIGGAPHNRAQAWEKFLRGPAFWALLGYGLWTVEERATGAYVGQVGFGRFERDMEPPLPDIPEGAWVLSADHHGRGYGGEALDAALRWADSQLRSAICCIIAPENTPSLRLAARMGFAELRRADYHGEITLVLERAAPRN